MQTSTPVFPPAAAMEILFTRQQIADRTREIGEKITADYAGKSVVLIGVLKGAAIFLADLARAIQVDNTFDFVAVSSYGRARVSSGAVKLIKDIDNPIEGKHVIIVEDILDTGLTLNYLRGLMLQHKPASLKIATCLDKPDRRQHQGFLSAAEPANIGILCLQLVEYAACSDASHCYWRDLQSQLDRARSELKRLVATRKPNERLAMILDIDETSLSNYCEMQ